MVLQCASTCVMRSACMAQHRQRAFSRRPGTPLAVLKLDKPVPAHVGSDESGLRSASRDVSAKALASDGDALPPPDPSTAQGSPRFPSSFFNTIVDAAVLGPYRAYSAALQRSPLLTKALTSGVGFILGDLIAQVCWIYTLRKFWVFQRMRVLMTACGNSFWALWPACLPAALRPSSVCSIWASIMQELLASMCCVLYVSVHMASSWMVLSARSGMSSSNAPFSPASRCPPRQCWLRRPWIRWCMRPL